jgi:hypothetical protein
MANVADDDTFVVGSSRFESVYALVALIVLFFACCWMLGSFVYHRETGVTAYAIFIAGLCLSGWGVQLAYRRFNNPAQLTFGPSSLTLSYAGSNSIWRWHDIETAFVIPLRGNPQIVLTFKPMRPSGIVPLEAHVSHRFQMSAESIRDEIIRRSRKIVANEGSE